MRTIRRKTIGEMGGADRSIRDHTNIIEALRAHGTNRAEELVVSRASASPSMWGSIPIIWIELQGGMPWRKRQ